MTSCTWLKLLPMNLDLTDKLIEPKNAVGSLEKNELPIGIMDEELRKLFTMWRLSDKALHEAVMRIEFGDSSDEDEHVADKKAFYDVLEALVWYSVRRQTNCWDKPIGLRSGWVVVTYDQKPKMLNIKDIFGG